MRHNHVPAILLAAVLLLAGLPQLQRAVASTTSPLFAPAAPPAPAAAAELRSFAQPPPPLPEPASVAWSPDGTRIALGGPFGILLYTATLQNPQRFANTSGAVTALAWSHDSRRLASIGADPQVAIWDV